MNERLNRLASELHYLHGASVRVGTFDERKKIQKTAFLMGLFSIQNDYTFRWYHAGPFSFELNSDYFPEFGPLTPSGNVPIDKEKLVQFKKVFGASLDDSEQLELYASVLYIAKVELGCFDKVPLIDRMQLRKPKFTSEQVTDAVNFLLKIPEFDSITRAEPAML